jgi:hypothetical protein
VLLHWLLDWTGPPPISYSAALALRPRSRPSLSLLTLLVCALAPGRDARYQMPDVRWQLVLISCGIPHPSTNTVAQLAASSPLPLRAASAPLPLRAASATTTRCECDVPGGGTWLDSACYLPPSLASHHSAGASDTCLDSAWYLPPALASHHSACGAGASKAGDEGRYHH